MALAPPHLRLRTKVVVYLQWLLMARSTLALDGVAWIGLTKGNLWRFSWQRHKTKNYAGVRDIWLTTAQVPAFLRHELLQTPTMRRSILNFSDLKSVVPYITRALKGRQMSIRRSATQEFMDHTPDVDQLITRTNHTNAKTARQYYGTRPEDLTPNESSSAESSRTTTMRGRRRLTNTRL